MSKLAIKGVRVFDGQKFGEQTTVVIENGLISDNATDAEAIDASGKFLLPGLIDAHIHLHGVENLRQLARWGVTTALDMGTWPPALVESLRSQVGVTDILSSGLPATAPGSRHSQIPGFPKSGLVATTEETASYIKARVEEGVDYIKVIADIPGFDQPTLNAFAANAKKHDKLIIAHTAQHAAYERARDANIDVLTHVPLDQDLDPEVAKNLKVEGRIVVPTLTMMETITKTIPRPGLTYDHACASVISLYTAGVPILAGTDANNQPGVPAKIVHGESLHHELELLVEVGLSNIEALRAATCLPAEYFGLSDRGIVEVGRRADLILLDKDPVVDIGATRTISRVWCKGIEVNLSGL